MIVSRTRRATLAALSVLTVAGLSTACGTDTAADAVSTTTAADVALLPDGTGSTAADGVFPRTVVHVEGETVLDAKPERVVVVSTGQLDAVLALGVMPVGTTAATGADAVPAYLLDAFEEQADELADLPTVGLRLEPDIEAIAALQPDLILINSVGAEQIGAALSGLAPTVVTQGTGVNWQQDLQLVAAALGRQQQAADILAGLLDDAADIGAGADGRTVSFVRITGDSPRVFGVGSFVGSIAEAAGLRRPPAQQFAETSQDLSLENLDLADGDVIYYSVQAGAADSPVLASDLWAQLPAITSGNAVQVDDDPWYLNAGPVAARLVIDQLATTLA